MSLKEALIKFIISWIHDQLNQGFLTFIEHLGPKDRE
jgi:hypothetical protein